MISIGESKASLCKGDFHPAALYKGDKKIAGYSTEEFEGEGIVTLTNCYNDKVYDVNIGDNTGVITVRGKNILDMSKYKVSVGYYFDSAGGENNTNTNFLKISPITVEPSTTYTISSNLYFYTIWFYSNLADHSTNAISKVNTYDVKKGTFTTPENCKYIRVSFDIRKMITDEVQGTALFQWAMLEKGKGDGVYEPFIEPQTVIFENGELKGEIPTFKGTTAIEIEADKNVTIKGKYKRKEV